MKLVELSGNGNRDLKDVNVRDLSDIDAAIWFLSMVARTNPGITWGQLLKKDFKMSGLGDFLGDGANWFWEKGGEVVDGTADHLGSIVRLITDEEVVSGIGSYAQIGAQGYAAYQSGGLTGLASMFSGGGGTPQQQQIAMSAMGQQVKGSFGGIDPMILYVGGGIVFLLIMYMAMK